MPTKPMADLRAQVGESVRTVEDLRVEAGKVEEFARALGDDDPAHRDADAAARRGFDAIPAPLTFTRTAYFPRYRPEGIDENLGFDLGFRSERVVHGGQAYEFDRPVAVGDCLTGTTTLLDVYRREGSRGGTMTFAEYETAFRDRGDDPVCTARVTRIETGAAIGTDGEADGAAGDAEAEGENGEDEGKGRDEADGADVAARGPGAEAAGTDAGRSQATAADVAVGDAAPPVVAADVQRQDFVRYAGASGDFNPIHYDEPYARAAGYDTVFGQGMLTAGYAAHMTADWFGLANVARFEVRFRERLEPGDTVTATGEVAEVDRRADGATVRADLAVTDRDGTRLLTGEAEAVLPAPESGDRPD